jgi:hypothetical protein
MEPCGATSRAGMVTWHVSFGPARCLRRDLHRVGEGFARWAWWEDELLEESSESEEIHPLPESGHLMRFGCRYSTKSGLHCLPIDQLFGKQSGQPLHGYQ